ncbi:hypothetical protein ACSSS7_003578 [Eimeria intestinalis]
MGSKARRDSAAVAASAAAAAAAADAGATTAGGGKAASTVEIHVSACEKTSKKEKKERKNNKGGMGGAPKFEKGEEGAPPEQQDKDTTANRKKGVSSVRANNSEDRQTFGDSTRKEKKLKQQQTEGQGAGDPEAAEAAGEVGSPIGGGAPRGPPKVRRKREGCWGPEEIAARKAELLEELHEKRATLSASRVKRIRARLAELSKAEQGLKQRQQQLQQQQLGGQQQRQQQQQQQLQLWGSFWQLPHLESMQKTKSSGKQQQQQDQQQEQQQQQQQ